MQDTDESGQREEVRVGLDQHALDLVEFGAGDTRLLGSLREAGSHRGENLELEV